MMKEDPYFTLTAAVYRQAITDASGAANQATIRKESDRQLAAGAAPWLDEHLPGWRDLAGRLARSGGAAGAQAAGRNPPVVRNE